MPLGLVVFCPEGCEATKQEAHVPGTLTLAMREEFAFFPSIHIIEVFGSRSSRRVSVLFGPIYVVVVRKSEIDNQSVGTLEIIVRSIENCKIHPILEFYPDNLKKDIIHRNR